ncbi:prolyl 4-hydroxylase subunit alpha-3-like [Branchiostoma lanceolatum]|uniref:prolyl 4-hydroxylase subunit alpha-3-like n=1 Tax=Branchiostoma lanceolatum TaxID=7740 RepID=UPI00345153DD
MILGKPVRVLLCVLFPAMLCTVTKAGFFSAVARLEKLVQDERETVAMVKQYIQKGGQVSTDMQRYVHSFDDSFSGRDHIARQVYHPVRAYLLIKRLSQVPNNLSEAQTLTGKEFELPTAEDLYMSALALVKLQHVYNLDMRSLVQGQILMLPQAASDEEAVTNITEVSPTHPTLALDASDTFYIGDVAFKENSFYQAALWFNVTLEMMREKEMSLLTVKDEPHGLKILDVLLKLADTVQRIQPNKAVSMAVSKLAHVCEDKNPSCPQWASMGECDANREFMLVSCRLSCGVCEVGQNVKEKKAEANADDLRLLSNLLRNVSSSLTKPIYTHENLCRLGVLKNQAPHPTLTCTYIRPSPYFYLSPVKMEVLHEGNPLVALYHDVITDKETAFMRDMALTKLERSLIQARHDGGGDVFSKTRVSETGWLFDSEHPKIAKLSRRVEQITGLDINCPSAEAFQLVNYGLGGLYEQHWDVLGHPEPKLLCISEDQQRVFMPTGERIVTFLFYLSDVEAGGATVFPNLNLAVPAVKNSAVLFHDLKKSLAFEENSLHAGCPVLMGSKWIANKWIRAYGNEFRWPCGLTPEE